MTFARHHTPIICARCLRRRPGFYKHRLRYGGVLRYSAQSSTLPQQDEAETVSTKADGKEKEPGGMSKRLLQMTEESIEQGDRGMTKAIEEGGFSEELKRRLEIRIQDSSFKSGNPAAFAQIDMPSSAGQGTRDVATAQPWSGSEKLEDAALRMLDDAHKPLRGNGPPKIPTPRGMPTSVDMRMKKAVKRSDGQRLANARDRTSVYALSQDATLSEKEREQMRRTLKERFTAGARPMPGSVQGLAALANERIEDAIARGQFKNIQRGKGTNVERDHNANSPFLDTTEYFMNKIIQKQDIVPPWIEKQQELVKAAAVFRGRLRADWKRHAARIIASKGGSLESQVRRAEEYAAAEAANNPKGTKTETMTEIDQEGKLSQLTVTETPTPSSDASDSKITVSEDLALQLPPTTQIQAASDQADPPQSPTTEADESTVGQPPRANTEKPQSTAPPPVPQLVLSPFRDPAWQSLELAYHTLAIKNLNNLTRTYNLQAPDLAKKPYFSLDRELRSCFADIAPQLPNEIRERARRPEKVRVEILGHRPGGVLEKFATDKVRVHDSRKPNYGFKDFWRNLWGAQDAKV